MKLIHGGDVYSYAEAHGGQLPLDLSANINPFGMPPSVRTALHAAVADCERYPDPLCRELRRAIGQAEGVPPDWLYCGGGAADVLDRLARALDPQRILVTAPAFAEYERSAAPAKVRAHMLRADEGFALTERFLDELHDVDIVYLCNPNNPTGCAAEPALLREIARRCDARGIWLVVDECFLDFLVDGEMRTLKDLLESQPRLVLLRAYTKMYAVPGVRLGFCMSANAALVDALYRAGQPWNVSALAQACGIAAAGERTFARRTARALADERAFLADGLRRLGFTVFDGAANFLLWRTGDGGLGERLAAHGVLVRDCSNYRGLLPGDYRAAVRTRADSRRLLAALAEVK